MMKRFFILTILLLLVSCNGKSKQSVPSSHPVQLIGAGHLRQKQIHVDPCPDFSLSIYHNTWLRLPAGCYVSNAVPDSVFVINRREIDFNEFIKRSGTKKINDFSEIDQGIYVTPYPKFYILDKLVTEDEISNCYYEDAEIYGYKSIR